MRQKVDNIFEEFSSAVQAFPSQSSIITHGKDATWRLTYSELFSKSLQLANLLRDVGVKPKDKVAFILGNQSEYAVSFFAVMSMGATVVPLDVQFSLDQIKRIMIHSDAKALIVKKDRYKEIVNSIKDAVVLSIDSDDLIKKLAGYPDNNIFNGGADADSLAAIFYTSGTTDEPKGVMLTHSNLLFNIHALSSLANVTGSDRMISILPLHHAYAFTTTLLLPLVTGSTVIFPSGLSSKELLSCIKEEKVTIFVAVPQVFSLMKRHVEDELKNLKGLKKYALKSFSEIFFYIRKLSNVNWSKKMFSELHKAYGGQVRLMVSGGARLDKNVAISFYKWGFSIIEGYGLTETSPAAAFNPIENPKIGSVGKALPGVEIKILNPDSRGVGEVLIKGPNVMAGYYKQEEKTREAIIDGWFYSGDLGYIDKNDYLYLVGRKKNVIVLSSGKNIDPEEIENIYSESKYIKELCVFPVSKEGFLAGVEHLAAVIVIEEKSFYDIESSNVREKIKFEIENRSSGQPSYKHISDFVIVRDSLPRTALGKIMRYKVEEIFKIVKQGYKTEKEELNENDLEIYNSKMSKPALAALKDILKKEVKINDHLELDLGLDSLSRIDVFLGLQERLGLEMSSEQAVEFFISSTVKDLLIKLREYFPDGAAEVKPGASRKWDEIIKQSPSQEIQDQIFIKAGLFVRIINISLILLIKLIFKVFFFLRVEGKENLKEHGPYLICPNHTSYLDGLVVLSGLPFKVALEVQFVGYSLIFKNILLKRLVKTGSIIPIDSSVSLIEALRACSFALRRSKIVCYFPEGERSFDGELEDFKKGVGILIKELNVPVVPVYIDGAFKAWPRARRFPMPYPIKVKFGSRATLDDLYGNDSGKQEIYEVIASNLRQKVLKLK
ncbi:MAG: AMP-binding protein [Candidatus Omnitrophica bacterium]|nr:AMP-binding protein [Candidatus Omnitrophota bacterium]